jgi:hypothetical protein
VKSAIHIQRQTLETNLLHTKSNVDHEDGVKGTKFP